MIESNNLTSPSKLLDKLYTLGVVFSLNFLVIGERIVLPRMFSVVETRGIEADRVLLASDILDLEVVRLDGPILRPFTCGSVCINVCVWLRAICRRGEVEELGSDGISLRHGK